jgi:hypothetical protein
MTRMRLRIGHALGLLVALAVVSGCAASPVTSTKAADEERLPGDVEGTLAALDQAEGELAGAIGPLPGAAPAEQPSPSPPPPAPLRAEGKSETEGDGAPEAQAAELRRSPCDTACRALSSMRRAVEHLCGLTGEGDARCASARERVRSADERVRAICPRCGS